MDLEAFGQKSRSALPQAKKLSQRLRKMKPKVVDETFHTLHEAVFEQVDCLSCANCCKTTSPLFLRTDIERLARVFSMKPAEFIDAYLRLDEEGDYVLQHSPCPFLGADNHCLVYEERPKACREYPHTNRKKMHGILNLTVKNTLICPAVHQIFKRLKRI
ncbi:putative Fe-S oxidoreductase [Nitritalea halalkaliphila LW7]|uniref:Putative Fe-S oxidoreductase n=1 Tax=Nitritalea halalkaliphila LW7 TaxID=1189621 RepID=I5C6X0_9BACT|nr:YkgJ family cysteine cluster protein [Nitritalea halalkaliphila]EIM77572.1 putative Fe-S oxidoreductase [Nitritalea halalkaliphila LW7]